MDVPWLFIHLPTEENVGSFQGDMITANITMNILIQAFMWTCFNFTWIDK